ncbi:MAG: serine/threonine-protein phosphatase [Planctomycetaceae bacterium]|jgi:PPM family protein phosphatase|nr:serine/threonine-protein phosphatase [Planctomycetaceae bacterium]
MAEHQHPWTDCLTVIEITDKGMRRATNQDSSVVVIQDDATGFNTRGHLFVVCDGMGAHAAGELASSDAVTHIPHHYLIFQDLTPPLALKQAIEKANHEIHRKGQVNPEFHNMGTTCSALLLLPQGAVVGHVGDSRVYRRREGIVEQLTFDHSLVWEMRAQGHQSDDIPSNVITRSLGPNPDVQVDCEGPFPVQLGDTFLLCSDGLNGEVGDAEIGAAMAALPPLEASQFLVDLANLRGGPDNITIIIIQVIGDRVCTDTQTTTPFESQQRKIKRTNTHPAFWITAIAFALAGLFLGLTDHLRIGLGAVGIGTIAGLAGLIKSKQSNPPEKPTTTEGPLGKGPYTRESCLPNKVILEKLLTTAKQIRKIAQTSNKDYRWGPFDEHLVDGTEYFQQGNYLSAFQTLAKGICYIMDEFRSK